MQQTRANLQQALSLLGMSTPEAGEAAAALAESTGDEFVEAFSLAVTAANLGYAADWRGDALSLLFFAVAAAGARGHGVELDKHRGKITLDVAAGDFYVWEGSKKAKHDDLASGWNAVPGDTVELRALTFWETSDTQYFLALSPQLWQQIEELLDPAGARLFTKPEGKGAFVAQPRPKPKKIDWNKQYLKIIPPRYQDEHHESGFRIEELGANAWRALNHSLQVPPRGEETRTLAYKTTEEVRYVFESVDGQLKDLDDVHRAPVVRWFVRRDTTDLATCLYARSLLAHLQFLWELYYWYWWPQNVSTIPQYLPSMQAEPVHLALAWFTLQALGCEREAARIAPLLEAPALHGMWYCSAKQKDHGWLALARLLANGVKTPDLMYAAAALPLLDRAAWDDPAILARALQLNLRDGGEECESDAFTYRCWPAPYYALARRLNVDLSQQRNPFLSMPVAAAEIRRDIRLIEQVSAALDQFAQLKPNDFRGLRADALVPPLEAELKAKIKAHKKQRLDDVIACQCGSIYLRRPSDRKVPDNQFQDALCSVCGQKFASGNYEFETELLIPVESDRI